MIMRRLAVSLARRFPTKVVTSRLMPWVTLFLAVTGGTVGLVQYLDAKNDARVARSWGLYEKYLDERFHPSMHGATRRLFDVLSRYIADERCGYIRDLIVNSRLPQVKVNIERRELDHGCDSGDVREGLLSINIESPDLREEFRKRLVAELGERISNDVHVRTEVELLADFYRGVIVCAESRSCDADTIISLFVRHMVEFVNRTCPFFEKRRSGRMGGVDIDIVRFLIYNDQDRVLLKEELRESSDSYRQKLFFCETLRQMEEWGPATRFAGYWLGIHVSY